MPQPIDIAGSQSQLRQAVKQIISNANFREVNRHLTDAEFQALDTDQIWPQKPVFSPYAKTHDGYSQIRLSYTKGKAIIHRVTHKHHYFQNLQGLEVSHTLYIGARTSTNINPLYLVAESNEVNQSRKFCALYFERILVQRYQFEYSVPGAVVPTEPPYIADFDQWM